MTLPPFPSDLWLPELPSLSLTILLLTITANQLTNQHDPPLILICWTWGRNQKRKCNKRRKKNKRKSHYSNCIFFLFHIYRIRILLQKGCLILYTYACIWACMCTMVCLSIWKDENVLFFFFIIIISFPQLKRDFFFFSSVLFYFLSHSSPKCAPPLYFAFPSQENKKINKSGKNSLRLERKSEWTLHLLSLLKRQLI